MTTTTTYMPIGDIPQRVLDGCKDEFGMEILYLPEMRTKKFGIVYAPQRDVLVISGGSDRYCSDCDEYVGAVQEIGLTWVNPDENESECEWDEIGSEFCPQCQNDVLHKSESEYADALRWDYEESRGLDRWRGLD